MAHTTGKLRVGARRIPARWCRARIRSARTAPAARGAKRAIWRHSSAPIEPPAPVTSTTRPVSQPLQSRGVEHHRIAPEQVVELDVAHLRHRDAPAHQVVERRHGQHLEPGVGCRIRQRGAARVCEAAGMAMIACVHAELGAAIGAARRGGPARSRRAAAGRSSWRRRRTRRRRATAGCARGP